MTVHEILQELQGQANPTDAAGMARFGINTAKAFGIRIPVLRALAKRLGKDHKLAAELWKTGYHEARILAGMVDDPAQVTTAQMDRWTAVFNSWDLCDQVCMNLFDRTPHAWEKALTWSQSEEEFVKRAGYALMACLAVHDKRTADAQFTPFFAAIKRGATDDRNFVKKAVNWALRQIGKRNEALRQRAIRVAEEIARFENKGARWVAADALRELRNRQ